MAINAEILMQKVLIRDDLSHQSGIGFWCWLPYTQSDALVVEINGIQISLSVNIEHSGTSLHNIKIEDIPKGNHWIQTLIIHLEVPVENENDAGLYNMNPLPDLEQKIADTLRSFKSRFYNIIRNEMGQFWLPNSHHIDALSDREILTGTRIKAPNGKWIQFCPGLISMNSMIPRSDLLINEARWKKLKKLIEMNFKPDLSMVFLRNARQHMADEEYRLAFVESCIALERAISIFLVERIPKENRQSSKVTLDGDSLKDKVHHLLPYLIDEIEINQQTILRCEDAVNLRNRIIHKAQVKIVKETANLLFCELEKVVRNLNESKFNRLEEDPWTKKNSV